MVIAFFDRIEFETGNFDEDFFGDDFSDIVNRHPKILKDKCKEIYDELRVLNQVDRTEWCRKIRESNDIEEICRGHKVPTKIDKKATGVAKMLRDLFLNLYSQVLDGGGFCDKYGTNLRAHFDSFSKLNYEITLCPICGIGELKKHEDKTRDQYDHYLPKAIYPFSSVNFENLVPCCKECNSFDAKGEKDTVNESTGTFFFPYDKDHEGINVQFKITKDNADIGDIEWQICFTNSDGKANELESWKNIYAIEDRYLGFVKARIEKLYRHYWSFINRPSKTKLTQSDKKTIYFENLEEEEKLGLSYIKKPALKAFLGGSVLAQAALEAKAYSKQINAPN
jgi:hypothetical protein